MSKVALLSRWSPGKSMISQNTRTIVREKMPSVIRTLAVGKVEYGDFIAAGAQNKKLYILTPFLEIIEEMNYPNWVRSVSTGDLDGDGRDEIICGVGDNSLRILKFNEELNSFTEICSFTFKHFVTTTVIVDIQGDGKKEIIAGSWDKTLRAFRLVDGQLEEIWVKQFDQRINRIIVGSLTSKTNPEMVVIFQDHGFAVMNAENMGILWSYYSEKAILDADIGVLNKGGLPYIVAAGEDQILYFFDYHGDLVHEINVGDRITALKIADIDGGHCNEILIAEGNKRISVFEMGGCEELYSIQLKWSNRIHGVLNEIIVADILQDGVQEIIYGGYDCAITIIQDFHYGEKEQTEYDVEDLEKAIQHDEKLSELSLREEESAFDNLLDLLDDKQ